MSPRKEKPPAAVSIFAGAIAGASETLVTYPTEYIKTQRQLPAQSHLSTTFIIRNTYASAGVGGFYTGCGTLAMSNALKSGVRFFSFASAKSQLQNAGMSGASLNVASGLCAGVAESIMVVTPGEALKTRMIQDATNSSGRRNIGTIGVVREILRTEGVAALWKGLGPVMGKQATNSAVRFATFEYLKEQVAKRRPGMEQGVGVALILGAMSGVVTVYASMPFDNIKTRLQSKNHGYTGMWDCATRMLRNEGVVAFWIGTTPRLARLTLSSGITFAVYDSVVNLVRDFKASGADQTLSQRA